MWIVILMFAAFFVAVVLIAFAISSSTSKGATKTLSRLESIGAPQSDAGQGSIWRSAE